jgi:hypothetical protein
MPEFLCTSSTKKPASKLDVACNAQSPMEERLTRIEKCLEKVVSHISKPTNLPNCQLPKEKLATSEAGHKNKFASNGKKVLPTYASVTATNPPKGNNSSEKALPGNNKTNGRIIKCTVKKPSLEAFLAKYPGLTGDSLKEKKRQYFAALGNPQRGPRHSSATERKHKVSFVYVKGIPWQRVKMLRSSLKEVLDINIKHVLNTQFLHHNVSAGITIVEFLVRDHYVKEFKTKIGHDILDGYDPRKPYKLDSTQELKRRVQSMYSKFVLSMCKKSDNFTTTLVYKSWAKELGILPKSPSLSAAQPAPLVSFSASGSATTERSAKRQRMLSSGSLDYMMDANFTLPPTMDISLPAQTTHSNPKVMTVINPTTLSGDSMEVADEMTVTSQEGQQGCEEVIESSQGSTFADCTDTLTQPPVTSAQHTDTPNNTVVQLPDHE